MTPLGEETGMPTSVWPSLLLLVTLPLQVLEVGELGYLRNHIIPEGVLESQSTSPGFSF